MKLNETKIQIKFNYGKHSFCHRNVDDSLRRSAPLSIEI